MNRFTVTLTFFLTLLSPLFSSWCVMANELSGTKPHSTEKSKPQLESVITPKKSQPTGAHTKEISVFSMSKDGRYAITADEDENNFIWDLKKGTLLREIGKPEAVRIRVVAAAFSPESSQLLWARKGKIMPVLWDVESGRRIGVLSSKDKGHTAHVVSMAFSADGRYIATGDTQGTIVIWNRADRSVQRRIKAHFGETRHLLFIKGRNELASAGTDGAVRLWDVTGSAPLATLQEPSEFAVTAMTTSEDGQFLYAALEDMTVKGWMVALRSLRSTLDFNNRQINSIALSPEGDYLAIAEEDESIQLWNIRESKSAWESMLSSSATKVLFSPDGKKLFSTGGDNWVSEWDVVTGNLVKKFGGIAE